MALGGYKFAGYKITLPADFDVNNDSQVIAQSLRVHRIKLRIFLDSCTLNGADWQFSETDGDYYLDSYGKVVYKLDPDGFGYASFFRYGSDNAYYCILTLSRAYYGASGTGTKMQNTYEFYSGSSTLEKMAITNHMECIGIEPISISNILSASISDHSNKLAIFDVRGNGFVTGNQQLTNFQGIYYGIAVKGKKVITISHSITSSVTNKAMTIRISAIDALNLSSPTDQSNMFSVTQKMLQDQVSSASPILGQNYAQVCKADGTRYEDDSTSSTYSYNSPVIGVLIPGIASQIKTSTSAVYEGATLSTAFSRNNATHSVPLNPEYIATKGKVDIDLLAVNNTYGASGLTIGSTYANGNYLCIYSRDVTSSSEKEKSGAIYCGWDPSNPDITQESAWPEYTE